MERYDIFQLIHKGLRAALYQTALQLQQTDFTQAEESESALNRVREVVMLFDAHAHKEDHYILPAVQAYEPSVVATFEAEHVADEQLGRELNEKIAATEQAAGDAEKIIAGRQLTEAFVAFTVFNLQHMAKEEDIINRLLWRYYDDAEIREISGKISQSVAPWLQDFYAGWMLRGINNPEAAAWMNAIQKGLPAVVYNTLLQKAKQELPLHRFETITQKLSKPSLAS